MKLLIFPFSANMPITVIYDIGQACSVKIWLDIGQVPFCVFMDLDFVPVLYHAK